MVSSRCEALRADDRGFRRVTATSVISRRSQGSLAAAVAAATAMAMAAAAAVVVVVVVSPLNYRMKALYSVE